MSLIKRGLYCPDVIVSYADGERTQGRHVTKMGRNKEFIKNFVRKFYWKRSFEDVKR
jgi:hypothetical protein